MAGYYHSTVVTVDLLTWVQTVLGEDLLSRATILNPLMLSRTLHGPIPCSRFVIRFFILRGGRFGIGEYERRVKGIWETSEPKCSSMSLILI